MTAREDNAAGARPPGGDEREAHRIFRQALDEPPDRRLEFVSQACAGRPSLLRRVEALLAAVDDADEFLETPALRVLGGHAPGELDGGLVGAKIGRYRVLAQLAAGGMGVVYLAEQENPRRTVALKVMRAGLASRKAHRLFEHEAQVLGRLQHPNIARIFEASTHSAPGHATPIPYFAMEYLAGAEPITSHARLHRLDAAARIGLFRKACLGVHHGHQKGIVHRDLKPANIIVDGSGEPRVIDYGVALATAAGPGAAVGHSDAGQLVGTLRYMSPEQCRGEIHRIDTRSDVYALGVVLYELLCDRFPLDLEDLSPMELPRVVSESAPIRPRVSSPDLPRDLETIILKAMAKDPEARYQSVADLERDLGRFLRHEPIEARPASAIYLSRLFVRRHRTLIGAGLFAAIAGVTAVAVSVGFGVAAKEAERRATEERDLAVQRLYLAHMAAAESALRAHEYGRLRAHLRSAPAAHRGWEWRHLLERSEPSLHVEERPAIVDAVACTPDGSLMLAGSRNGVVGIWSLADRTLRGELRVDSSLVLDLALSPDGTRVAATTDGGAIELFDLAEQRLLWRSEGRHGDASPDGPAELAADHGARAISFAPDGLTICSAGNDGTLCAWDARDGTRRWTAAPSFAGAQREIMALAHHPLHPMIASGGPDGSIELRSSEDGHLLRTLSGHPGERVVSLLFSHDGATLYSGGNDRVIAVWDPATGERVRTLLGHERSVWSLAISRDGATLASASIDHTLRLWSTADGAPKGVLHGHGDAVADVAWTPDGSRIVSGSWDRSVRIWDPSVRDDSVPPRVVGEVIDHIEGSADGRLLATAHGGRAGSVGGAVMLRDATTLALLGVVERAPRAYAVAFTPDGRGLCIGWGDGIVTCIDTRTGVQRWSHRAHDGPVLALGISADGTRVATGGRRPAARLWTLGRGLHSIELLRELDSASSSAGVLALSPDGARLATASTDGIAQLWDLASGAEVATLIGHQLAIYSATFSPDGRSLLTGSRDQTIRVWDAATGALERTLGGHGEWVTALAFTPDGSRLVSSSWFETLNLWDAERLEPIVSLRGHDRPVRALAILGGGERIVTGDDAGTIRVWDDRPRSARLEAAHRAQESATWAQQWVDSIVAHGPPGADIGDQDAATATLAQDQLAELADRIERDTRLDALQRRAALNELLRRSLGAARAEGSATPP